MNPQWRLQLLGTVRAVGDGSAIERFPTRKTGAVLAWLALNQDLAQPRESLAERFWPGAAPASSRNNLSQALSALRRLLERETDPESVIVADRANVGLAAGALATDVADFTAAIARAEKADHASQSRLDDLNVALDLYPGEFMPAYYDDWILRQREALSDLHQWALSALVEALVDSGSADEAVRHARRAVAAEPMVESARRDLIRALIAAERPGEAVAQFRALQSMLETELGVAPSDESRAWIEPFIALQRVDGSGAVAGGADTAAAPRSREAWTGAATCLVVRAPEDLPAADAAEHVRSLARIVHDFDALVLQPGARETVVLLPHAGDGVAIAVEARRSAEVPLKIGLHTGELRAAPSVGEGAPYVIAHAVEIARLVRPGRIVMTQATVLMARPALEDEERLVPLGRFRLSEGPEREALFELTPAGNGAVQPGGAVLDAVPVLPSTLPIRRDRMVGRTIERLRLGELLAQNEARLVTITGMGGTGKSRLAAAAAGDREGLGEGRVVWVELAALDDPNGVAGAIAEAVGLPPEARAEPIAGLAGEFEGTAALLVLDNLEQLLPEAARTVAALLDACPGVTCLCTSRRRLGLAGEIEFKLSPLPVPDIDALERLVRESPSVELFVDRVRALQPDFLLDSAQVLDIARLCAALEGVPLAIELAAARASVLSPRQMVDRIQDRLRWLADERADLGERQRSLRGAIDWSYDLLTDAQRRAFAQASVFKGAWDIEAAEAVFDDPLVIDRLAELRDASLLTTSVSGGIVRYSMLEMLREFAAEHLATDPAATAEMRARHAEHFAEIADQAKHALTGPDQAVWLERLASDDDNLHAAMTWCASADGNVQTGLKLACGLQYYWYTRGHWLRGLEEIKALLMLPGSDADPGLHAKAARVAGGLATHLDLFEEATQYLEMALATQRVTGDRYAELVVMTQLAVLAQRLGDFDRTRRLAEQCADGFRKLEGDKAQRGLSASLNLLGLSYRSLGEVAAARPYLEESLEVMRNQMDSRAISDILENIAQIDIAEGRLSDAHSRLVEAMGYSESVESKWSVLRTMMALANVHADAGDHARAVRCHGAIEALESHLGQRNDLPLSEERAAMLVALRSGLGDSDFEAEWTIGAGLSWGEAIAEASFPLEQVAGRSSPHLRDSAAET